MVIGHYLIKNRIANIWLSEENTRKFSYKYIRKNMVFMPCFLYILLELFIDLLFVHHIEEMDLFPYIHMEFQHIFIDYNTSSSLSKLFSFVDNYR